MDSAQPGNCVIVPKGMIAALEEEAARAMPNEAVALLVGRGSEIMLAVPAENISGEPEISFAVGDDVLLATHKKARRDGLAIVGVWHTHPSGVAEPSETDSEHAFEPGYIWLVSAPGPLGRWQTAAFQAPPVPGGAFVPLDVREQDSG